MTTENEKELIEILKTFHPTQPFTIEELLRNLGKSKDQKWDGIFEVQAQEEIEKYLLKRELIIDTKKTSKLYNIDIEVNKL